MGPRSVDSLGGSGGFFLHGGIIGLGRVVLFSWVGGSCGRGGAPLCLCLQWLPVIWGGLWFLCGVARGEGGFGFCYFGGGGAGWALGYYHSMGFGHFPDIS